MQGLREAQRQPRPVLSVFATTADNSALGQVRHHQVKETPMTSNYQPTEADAAEARKFRESARDYQEKGDYVSATKMRNAADW
jgi:hypothetical protein